MKKIKEIHIALGPHALNRLKERMDMEQGTLEDVFKELAEFTDNGLIDKDMAMPETCFLNIPQLGACLVLESRKGDYFFAKTFKHDYRTFCGKEVRIKWYMYNDPSFPKQQI